MNDQSIKKLSKLCLRSSVVGRSGQLHPLGYRRPAALVLPATQHVNQHSSSAGGGHYGHMALRARLSPANSLFNRLDGFVHQLQLSRDFFADWPQRLCQRQQQQQTVDRRQQQQPGNRTGSANVTGANNNLISGNLDNTGSHQQQQQQQQSACWNGRDFSGYSKPLAPFGQTLTSQHPEVPMSQPGSFNPIVLHFVAKLREIGAQLARKSTRSPSVSLFHSMGGADALMSSIVHQPRGSAKPEVAPDQPEAAAQQSRQPLPAAANSQQAQSTSTATEQQDQQTRLDLQAAAASISESHSEEPETEEEPEAGDESAQQQADEASLATLMGQGDEEETEAEDSSDEADDSALAGGEEPDDSNESDFVFSCKMSDCSDLLGGGADATGANNQPPVSGNHIDTLITPIYSPATTQANGNSEFPDTAETVVVSPNSRHQFNQQNSRYQQTQVIRYPPPPPPYDPHPSSFNNDLYVRVQPEYVERQTSGSSSFVAHPSITIHFLWTLLTAASLYHYIYSQRYQMTQSMD